MEKSKFARPQFLSRDNRLLAIRGKDGISVVNFDTLEERIQVGDAAEGHFSNDGRRLVCVHRMESGVLSRIHTIKVWDVEAGRELASYSSDEVGIAFSPDYRCFLVRKEGEAATVLEEIGGEQRRILLKGTGDVRAFGLLRFCTDGTRLLTEAFPLSRRLSLPPRRRPIRVWDVKSGEGLFRLEGPRLAVTTFNPDSKRIVGWGQEDPASEDDLPPAFGRPTQRGAVKVWDATTGHELLSLRLDDVASATPVFSPDGHRLMTTPTTGKIRTWDATPREAPQR